MEIFDSILSWDLLPKAIIVFWYILSSVFGIIFFKRLYNLDLRYKPVLREGGKFRISLFLVLLATGAGRALLGCVVPSALLLFLWMTSTEGNAAWGCEYDQEFGCEYGLYSFEKLIVMAQVIPVVILLVGVVVVAFKVSAAAFRWATTTLSPTVTPLLERAKKNIIIVWDRFPIRW